MFGSFYRLLYQLLSWLYLHLCWIRWRFQLLRLWSYDFCRSRGSGITNKSRDLDLLKRCKAHLSKIPRHLSIIIGAEQTHTQLEQELLAQLFTYALVMDIDCVSVYDARQQLVNVCGTTLERITVPKEVHCKKLRNNCYQWSLSAEKLHSHNHAMTKGQCTNGTKIPAIANGSSKTNGHVHGAHQHSNGICLSKAMQIIEISAQDGRALIVDVCREMYAQRDSEMVQEMLQSRNNLTVFIDAALSKRLCHIPDPELCIVLNSFTCTYGLLPWQTRFTEFHTIETGAFSAFTFAEVLYRYSRCEQRWGK